jgi:hypothetical protein
LNQGFSFLILLMQDYPVSSICNFSHKVQLKFTKSAIVKRE